MPSDFELAELEKIASVIIIIGAIITIISANKVQQIEVQKLSDEASSNDEIAPPTPTQLAVLVTFIYLISNILFGQIAFSRLEQVQEDIQAGIETDSATPNVLITVGWIFSIIGSISRLVGALLREEQEQPITIL